MYCQLAEILLNVLSMVTIFLVYFYLKITSTEKVRSCYLVVFVRMGSHMWMNVEDIHLYSSFTHRELYLIHPEHTGTEDWRSKVKNETKQNKKRRQPEAPQLDRLFFFHMEFNTLFLNPMEQSYMNIHINILGELLTVRHMFK